MVVASAGKTVVQAETTYTSLSVHAQLDAAVIARFLTSVVLRVMLAEDKPTSHMVHNLKLLQRQHQSGNDMAEMAQLTACASRGRHTFGYARNWALVPSGPYTDTT